MSTVSRLKSAIADTERYINLEGPRSADLCSPEITARLAFYRAHKAKLEAMLKVATSTYVFKISALEEFLCSAGSAAEAQSKAYTFMDGRCHEEFIWAPSDEGKNIFRMSVGC